MRAALAELRKRVTTAAVPQAAAPAAASAMDTDCDEVHRKRKDTLDGLLSKFELDGETEEVKLTAEKSLFLSEAWKKTKLE